MRWLMLNGDRAMAGQIVTHIHVLTAGVLDVTVIAYDPAGLGYAQNLALSGKIGERRQQVQARAFIAHVMTGAIKIALGKVVRGGQEKTNGDSLEPVRKDQGSEATAPAEDANVGTAGEDHSAAPATTPPYNGMAIHADGSGECGRVLPDSRGSGPAQT